MVSTPRLARRGSGMAALSSSDFIPRWATRELEVAHQGCRDGRSHWTRPHRARCPPPSFITADPSPNSRPDCPWEMDPTLFSSRFRVWLGCWLGSTLHRFVGEDGADQRVEEVGARDDPVAVLIDGQSEMLNQPRKDELAVRPVSRVDPLVR